VSGRCRKRWSGSGVDPIYRNRLERGAAFSPLTIRSHALVVGSGKKNTTNVQNRYILNGSKIRTFYKTVAPTSNP